MCAILGISFAPDSPLDRRKITAALASEGQVRGSDASGYAFVSPGGSGLYKKDVRGSQLHVGKIPHDASAIIIHTRAATHGSPRDNDNNHPIESPSGKIRLIHNGVVYNHDDVRELLGRTGKNLPEVDSSVIPAIIEDMGLEGTSLLSGYASAAWFDEETDDTIHLARFKTSTVFYAALWDGSLAFASTASILARALNKAGVAWYGTYPEPFNSMKEGEYFQILGGEILAESTVSWKSTPNRYQGFDYSAQTEGGSSRSTTGGLGRGSESSYSNYARNVDASKPMALQVVNNDLDDEDGDDDESFGELSRADRMKKAVISSMFRSDSDDDEFADDDEGDLMSEEDYDEWVRTGQVILHPSQDDPEYHVDEFVGNAIRPASITNVQPMFYTMSHDGDYVTYTSESAMLSSLVFISGLSGAENHLVGPEEGNLRWVNHIADIGALDETGATQFSWIKSEGDWVIFEAMFPAWLRDGVHKLRPLVGA